MSSSQLKIEDVTEGKFESMSSVIIEYRMM